MKLSTHGKSISGSIVENVSEHGIWLFVNGKEYYLPHEDYPWFKNARLSEIYNVRLLNKTHLHWPDLDVDLELESLQNPEKYPLIYKSS